jgi:hypothetical protein
MASPRHLLVLATLALAVYLAPADAGGSGSGSGSNSGSDGGEHPQGSYTSYGNYNGCGGSGGEDGHNQVEYEGSCHNDNSNCSSPNNWAIYKSDVTTHNADCGDSSWNSGQQSSSRSGLPTSCKRGNWSCTCTKTSWRIGPWGLPTNVAAVTTKPSASAMFRVDSSAVSRATCCGTCTAINKNTSLSYNCAFWQHFVPPSATGAGCNSPDSCGYCLIYPSGLGPTCNLAVCTDSSKPNYGISSNMSTVGRSCTSVSHDPHFVGAHGTHFDFNGLPDQSFCLVTDPKFQVNMKMIGYLDTRTYGASLMKDGKAVRTWIKELGLLWKDAATGVTHALKMVARSGKEQKREDGFMGAIVLDGVTLARMQSGDSWVMEGGLSIKFVGVETRGGGFYEVDVYEVNVAGLISMMIKLRVAHPLLQTDTEAMTHISAEFTSLANTFKTHGVLGQTFLPGRDRRAMDYSLLSVLMHGHLSADSENGAGFLDGAPMDYRTTDVLSPDCKYSAFDGRKLPSSASLTA